VIARRRFPLQLDLFSKNKRAFCHGHRLLSRQKHGLTASSR
jgi:hypothetical protein